MKCPSCGASDLACKYCPECGTKLIDAENTGDSKNKQEKDKYRDTEVVHNEKYSIIDDYEGSEGDTTKVDIVGMIRDKSIFCVIGVILCTVLLMIVVNNKNEPIRTVTEDKRTPLTVDYLLKSFSDWDKTVFTKSPIALEIPNKAILTVMENNSYVDWAEVAILAPNRSAASMDDNELAPALKLLSAVLPDWDEGSSWLKNSINDLPATSTIDNWKLRLEYSNNTGLILVANQEFPASTSNKNENQSPSQTTNSTPQSKTDSLTVEDFERLIVTNGKPIVFAASIESDNGPAISKYDSDFLGIWVTKEWDYLTDSDKRVLVKLDLDVFNQWRGKDDGFIIVHDRSNTKIASGNEFSISLED